MADFGDKKQAERDLDELMRQLTLSKEAKEAYPNISGLLGEASPEDYYRFEPEEFGILDKFIKKPRKYKEDLSYGNIYKQAPKELKQYEEELPPDTKKLWEKLRREKAQTQAFSLRSAAENLAAKAFDKDILKSKDQDDFINKLMEFEKIKNINLEKHPELEGQMSASGVYTPEERKLELYSNRPGVAMHEIGHARMEDAGKINNHAEGQNDLLGLYLARKYKQDPESYNKYEGLITGGKEATISNAPRLWSKHEPDENEKQQLLKEAVESGNGALVAEQLSAGHHGDPEIINYPIHRTMEEYENQLGKRGFEKEKPEKASKFEKLRSIIPLIRNINK